MKTTWNKSGWLSGQEHVWISAGPIKAIVYFNICLTWDKDLDLYSGAAKMWPTSASSIRKAMNAAKN